MNSSLGDLDTDIYSKSSISEPQYQKKVIYSLIILICIPGMIGNGIVIRLLGCMIKRNSFTVYILNLAMADSGTLLFLFLIGILDLTKRLFLLIITESFISYFILNLLSFVLYNTSQLLLISISVDRCVSVLFPIWHQCHRPPKLSLIVCAVTWVLPLVYFVLELAVLFQDHFLLFQLIFNGLISYPLMVISSLILLVKIFFKQHQQKRKRVLTVTFDLTSVLGALFTNSPIEYNMMADIFLAIIYSTHPWFQHIFILALVSDICIAVNSSINPILYFLAGRNKDDQSRVSIKLALHRVFRNEEDTKENEMQPDKTSL
uniref:G-protein coupled receptors family 1 profile domain-containing protein n=1 Tax=Pseudonaja textilis TaxID=8673 RepID=A0A670YVS7_PSETE